MQPNLLKDFIPLFIASLQQQGRSIATILAYRADLEQLALFLQARSIVEANAITRTDIETFRDTLITQKYTPKSVSRKLNAIKTFFRWLLTQRKIAGNPAEDVSHPKIVNPLPRFLTPLEYRALRDLARTDLRSNAIIELVLQTGLRISEVSALKVEDVYDDHIVVKAFSTQPQRIIPLNQRVKEALDMYLAERGKAISPYVFLSKTGRPVAVRNIRSTIDRLMQRADIPNSSVNDLRTTFIVENLKAGVDIVLLAQMTGHKRLSTTERYMELAEIKEPGKRQQLIEL